MRSPSHEDRLCTSRRTLAWRDPYGRLLAAEARERADLIVLECEVELSGNRSEDRRRVLGAGRMLAEADLVHLQYNYQNMSCVWGPRWRQFLNLTRFARALRVPMVATVHDIYRHQPLEYYWMARHPISQIRRMSAIAPSWATLRWLRRQASALFVSSEEEGRRLEPPHSRVRVIPHFVERRELTESAEEARSALGLRGRRVVTLLGFIHERKGHRLLIEALAALPSDVVAIAAVAPPPPALSSRACWRWHRLAVWPIGSVSPGIYRNTSSIVTWRQQALPSVRFATYQHRVRSRPGFPLPGRFSRVACRSSRSTTPSSLTRFARSIRTRRPRSPPPFVPRSIETATPKIREWHGCANGCWRQRFWIATLRHTASCSVQARRLGRSLSDDVADDRGPLAIRRPVRRGGAPAAGRGGPGADVGSRAAGGRSSSTSGAGPAVQLPFRLSAVEPGHGYRRAAHYRALPAAAGSASPKFDDQRRQVRLQIRPKGVRRSRRTDMFVNRWLRAWALCLFEPRGR